MMRQVVERHEVAHRGASRLSDDDRRAQRPGRVLVEHRCGQQFFDRRQLFADFVDDVARLDLPQLGEHAQQMRQLGNALGVLLRWSAAGATVRISLRERFGAHRVAAEPEEVLGGAARKDRRRRGEA